MSDDLLKEDLTAVVTALKAEIEELKLKSNEVKSPEVSDDLLEDVKQDKRLRQEKSKEEQEIKNTVLFIERLPIKIKEWGDYVPEEFLEIVNKANADKYDNDLERSNVIRAALVKSFFSIDDNNKYLTTSFQTKINRYLSLTNKAKLEESAEAFELLEAAIHSKLQLEKAKQLEMARSGLVTGDNRKYDAKFFAKKAHYINKK